MTKNNFTKITPLCARCASYELNEWLNENLGNVKLELAKAIREELKSINLSDGNCIVCNQNKNSYGWFEKISKLLEKYNAQDELKKEFSEYFGFN